MPLLGGAGPVPSPSPSPPPPPPLLPPPLYRHHPLLPLPTPLRLVPPRPVRPLALSHRTLMTRTSSAPAAAHLHHIPHPPSPLARGLLPGGTPAGPGVPAVAPATGSVEDVFRAGYGVHLQMFTGSTPTLPPRRGKRSRRSGTRGSRGSARCRAAAGRQY
ncbi:hypothetical protein C2845_PM01G44590 [Panicum miliaceum]|uniref:Uncharacterized protein n=1 Tax=Panicum miliaceum TaxID=4540 RepID=A0A3L6TPI8_PANMI|nr:hypothetical protein C2845_PM01G44590 [Panicum miliaceum]